MIKIIFLLILTFIPILSKWEKVNSPKGPNLILDMYANGNNHFFANNKYMFISKNNGFSFEKIQPNGLETLYYINKLIGIDDTLFVNSIGNIGGFVRALFRSTDFGNNWENISVNFNSVSNFNFLNDNYYLLADGFLFNSKNNGQTWDTIGDYIGNIKSDFFEINSNLFLIADKGSNDRFSKDGISNNGIFASFDNGLNFTNISNEIGIDGYYTNDVKLYKDFIFIATSKGLYKSDNHGLNWQIIRFSDASELVEKIETINDSIYVGTNLGRIYKSSDFGENWEIIYQSLYSEKILGLKNLNNQIIFSQSGKEYGVYKIINRENVKLIEFDYTSKSSLVFDTNNKLNLLSQNSGIYRSDDYGDSWYILNDSLFNNRIFFQKILSKEDIIIAFTTYRNEVILSKDNGKTWSSHLFGNNNNYINDILILEDSIYVLTNSNGIFKTTDFGENWNNIYFGENNFQLLSIKEINGKLISNTYRNGFWISEDYGYNWKMIENNVENFNFFNLLVEFSLNDSNIVSFKISPTDFRGNKIIKSSDFGKNWYEIEVLEHEQSYITMKNYNNNLFLLLSNGFYYSTNFGETWQTFNDGLNLENSETLRDITIVNDYIYLTKTRGIYKLNLNEIGINMSSVESIESRNYLYVYPPFPHPTNKEIKINLYWDNYINFNLDNIEIYNLNGFKIDTQNTIFIEKESLYNGQIIWDLSKYQPGIYLIKINYGTENRVVKVIKPE